MKKSIQVLLITFVCFSCTKKKDDPAPNPVVVTKAEEKKASLPAAYWPLIRSEKYQCCPYDRPGYTYEIYAGHNDSHSPKADFWQVKLVSQTNPVITYMDTTISVWWEGEVPKSDFFIFKLGGTDGKTWMRSFPNPPPPPQVASWTFYQSN